MPLNVSRSDRRLLLWAALIFFPIILALSLLSSKERDSGIPTTYSAQPSGAKAAYLLLRELGYNVERWEQPPQELPADAGGTVLVLANPSMPPSPEEKSALQLYLARGGKILATGWTVDLYLPQAQSERELVPPPLPKKYQPRLPTALTRAGEISMSPVAYWKDCGTVCLAHYSDESRPVVVSYSFSHGQVIWWGSSGPLSNSEIGAAGNLELLLNSLGRPGEARILWDEYFHSAGARRTIGSYIADKPVLFAFAQLGLLALALILTYSRRNGPVYPANEPSRLSPLEFVETVGGLYRRAHAVRAALEVPYSRFRAQAIRQLGLKSDVTTAALARAIHSRLRYKDDALEDLLQRIDAALYDPELQESTVLALVQELMVHARRMVSFERQEIFSHASNLPGAHSR